MATREAERCLERYVVGVDVGGTNTDTAILCGREVVAFAKRPTTGDVTSGIVNSIRTALDSLSGPTRVHVLSKLARVSIGTTHFTNAVKERSRLLRKVAVIRLCGTASVGLPPFVDFLPDLHKLICGGYYLVGGGLEYNGDEISPVDETELRNCVRKMIAGDPAIKNVVISGVFAPRDSPNEGQEARAARIIQNECPDISCTLSHEIGHLGLLERENAAILNESLKPLAEITVTAFTSALDDLGMKCPVFLTQNDGTMISASYAKRFPILTYSSGPTNSMRGAGFLTGYRNAIVVDIGGTTTDVGVLVNGSPREASTHCVVGDVRTNFSMPDVQSIPLGGGTIVKYDEASCSVEVGPESVGYRITEAAICFGGDVCTTTDVAIAAGVDPGNFCTNKEKLVSLKAAMVYAVMREIKKQLEAIIDSMKVEREDVTVVLVGGGCILVDSHVMLRGVSNIVTPRQHWGVANAVGAALGTVGGSCDRIEDMVRIEKELVDTVSGAASLNEEELYKKAKQIALRRAEETARNDAIKKGAIPSTVSIHDHDVIEIAYVPNCLRVKAKAIGSLDITAPEPSPPSPPSPSPSPSPLPSPAHPDQLRDNPHWPNSSEEDAASDIAANLPPPTLQGDVWVLMSEDVKCLAIGAGIMGCGGGGDPNEGRLLAQQLLRQGQTIKVLNPYRVNASRMGLCCGVAFMGAPAILLEKLVNGSETIVALQELRRVLASGVCEVNEGKEGNRSVRVQKEDITVGASFPVYIANKEDLSQVDYTNATIPLNHQITAIYCLEVGGCNSIEPLIAGAKTGLPVIDADGMGRAFPELQMFVPFIHGLQAFPSAIADNKGEVIALTNVATPKQLEHCFRLETVRMGMSAGIAIGVLTYQELLDHCVLFTLSHAWQLGRVVMRARKTHSNVIQTIVQQQNGLVLIIGKVITVDRETAQGFTTVDVVVEGLDEYAGYKVLIHAKNENYIAHRLGAGSVEESMLACTPDLISVIDSDTGEPVTTEQIRYGMRVGVIVLHANPVLTTEEALRVVGPRAFGYDIDYRLPKALPLPSLP